MCGVCLCVQKHTEKTSWGKRCTCGSPRDIDTLLSAHIPCWQKGGKKKKCFRFHMCPHIPGHVSAPHPCTALLHWAPWATLYSSDASTGALSESFTLSEEASLRSTHSHSTPDDEWPRLSAAVRGLFARSAEVRVASSKKLQVSFSRGHSVGGLCERYRPYLKQPHRNRRLGLLACILCAVGVLNVGGLHAC